MQFLHSQQHLIKLKQSLIDLKDIIIPIHNEIPNDLVEHATSREGESDGGQQGLSLVQIQPQGDGEGDDGLLGGAVVLVALDFGEGTLVHVGALVALHVGHTASVDEIEQHLLEAHVHIVEIFPQGASLFHALARLGHRRFDAAGSLSHASACRELTAIGFFVLGAVGIVVVLVVLVHVFVVDEGADIVKQLLTEGIGLLIEHADIDRQLVVEQELGDGLDGEFQHLILGVAIDARADQRKRHRLAVVFYGQFEGFQIAGAQDDALASKTPAPHGAGGVDDVLAGEVIPARDLGLAETEGREAGALGVQFFPGDGMYGEVYAAVTDHFFVGGVDDGVYAHFGDVVADNL